MVFSFDIYSERIYDCNNLEMCYKTHMFVYRYHLVVLVLVTMLVPY